MKHNTKLVEVKGLGSIHAIDTGTGNLFVPKIKEMHSIKLLPDDVVVDIGAHIGVFALFAARAGVAKVTAYEPDPSNFEVLELNRFDLPNFEAYPVAITGEQLGFVELYLSKGPGLRNSLRKIQGRETLTVPSVSYADAVAGASVVKIDVEGAEYSYPLVQEHLRALIIDFHPVGEDWIERVSKILAEFESAGFTVVDRPKFKKGWNASWDACASLLKTKETGEVQP